MTIQPVTAADLTEVRRHLREAARRVGLTADSTAGLSIDLPPPDEIHGRGLWLARRLCDEVSFHRTDVGTLVRLSAGRQAR